MPTHGSLTKAGKVRAQTPLVERTSKSRRSLIPRLRNKKNYKKYLFNMKNSRWRRRRR